MKPNLPLTLLGAALLAVPYTFGQGGGSSATSGVVGFSTASCPAGGSVIVPSLVNSSVYQGSAAISGDGLLVTPTVSPSWIANTYNATSFLAPAPNYPKFYIEIVSGPNEGLILDVGSNTTNSIALASAAPAAVRGGSFQIALRPHVTLSQLFANASGLSAGDDQVIVYDASTGGANIRTYVGGANVFVAGVSPAGHTPIYPGTGFIVSLVEPVNLTFMGEVKPTKTQVPLWPAGANIVGVMNPASATLLYGNSLGTLLAPGDDVIAVYSNNGLMVPKTYRNDTVGNIVFGPNALTPASTDALPLNSGAVISVVDPITWIINSPLAP